MRNPFPHDERSGFPLATVVVLVTFVACALACVDAGTIGTAMPGQSADDWAEVALGSAISAIIGGLVGLAIGWRHRRRFRGAILGFVPGSCAGVFLVALVIAPAPPPRVIAATGVLLLTTVVLRWKTI